MKKSLFILATAAIALASCNNDVKIAENKTLNDANEITFRPLVPRVMRAPAAADIDAGNGTSGLKTVGFKVFATNNATSTIYFGETNFTWNDGTSSYTSAEKRYWPSSGALDFYAYASNGSSTITHTANTKVFEITPNSAAASQSDFVFANTNNKSKGSSADDATYYGKNGVVLNFRHAMSKVTIKIQNSNSTLTATIKDVTLGYIDNKGTYTYTGSTSATNTDGENSDLLKFGDWANTGASKTSYTQTATTTSYTSAIAATALPQSFILVPHTLTTATAYSAAAADSPFNGANVQVELKLQNTATSAYILGAAETYVTAMWNLPAGSWEPGKHYIYTVDVAGGGYYPINHDTDADLDPILEDAIIKFVSVTVDDWSNGGSTDIAM